MTEAFTYDVALSFAGEDRAKAEELAALLRGAGVHLFYDDYKKSELWGQDLFQGLQEVYRDRSRYCVVFISAAYVRKPWTRHELAQIQARVFRDGSGYLLPLRLDDTQVPGLNPTVGYLDLRKMTIGEVHEQLLEKLGAPSASPPASKPPLDPVGHGYLLAEGHAAPKGIFALPLAPPPPCGSDRFRCVERIESASRLREESTRFAIQSDELRQAVATASQCSADAVGEIWSLVVGPPHTHLVVALLDGQLVVLKVDFDGRTFAPVELVPPFPSPGRCDTRAVATVDVLQDGGRQLLLASDGISGSGLGQTVAAVYRLDGGRLASIFEAELDFNIWLDINDGTAVEERSTTLQWSRESTPDKQPRILTVTTRTLGEVRSVRDVEYEWNGTTFLPANRDQEIVASREEQARFDAEEARLRGSG
jgi:hypothetical protein